MAIDKDRKKTFEEFVKAAAGVAGTSPEAAAIVLAYAAKGVHDPKPKKEEEKEGK